MALPQEVLSWKLGEGQGTIHTQNNYRHNMGYNLLCRNNSDLLTWGERDFGINLVWTQDRTQKKIHFRKQDGSEGEILTGDKIAFGLGGDPSFLYYAQRDWGINLKWSETPKFEWQLFNSSGTKGDKIKIGEWIAFLNVNVEPDPDFLVYFKRQSPTINLGWTTSRNWLIDLGRKVEKVAAQRAVEAAIAAI